MKIRTARVALGTTRAVLYGVLWALLAIIVQILLLPLRQSPLGTLVPFAWHDRIYQEIGGYLLATFGIVLVALFLVVWIRHQSKIMLFVAMFLFCLVSLPLSILLLHRELPD